MVQPCFLGYKYNILFRQEFDGNKKDLGKAELFIHTLNVPYLNLFVLTIPKTLPRVNRRLDLCLFRCTFDAILQEIQVLSVFLFDSSCPRVI